MQNRKCKLLAQYLPADYSDTYTRTLAGKETVLPEELLKRMFFSPPRWIRGLMKLRNLLVKPLGLKNDGFEEHLSEMIRERSDREIVFGMDDKHLRFHAAVWCSEKFGDQQTIGVTTVVNYHNATGKVYFSIIRPFHGMIIRSLLKGI